MESVRNVLQDLKPSEESVSLPNAQNTTTYSTALTARLDFSPRKEDVSKNVLKDTS